MFVGGKWLDEINNQSDSEKSESCMLQARCCCCCSTQIPGRHKCPCCPRPFGTFAAKSSDPHREVLSMFPSTFNYNIAPSAHLQTCSYTDHLHSWCTMFMTGLIIDRVRNILPVTGGVCMLEKTLSHYHLAIWRNSKYTFMIFLPQMCHLIVGIILFSSLDLKSRIL